MPISVPSMGRKHATDQHSALQPGSFDSSFTARLPPSLRKVPTLNAPSMCRLLKFSAGLVSKMTSLWTISSSCTIFFLPHHGTKFSNTQPVINYKPLKLLHTPAESTFSADSSSTYASHASLQVPAETARIGAKEILNLARAGLNHQRLIELSNGLTGSHTSRLSTISILHPLPLFCFCCS